MEEKSVKQGIFLTLEGDEHISFVYDQAEKNLKILAGSHEQNAFSFLKKVTILNQTDHDILSSRLHIDFLPAEIVCEDIPLACLEKNKNTEVTSFPITLSPRYLYQLSEKMAGMMKISLVSMGGIVLASVEENISLLPINESAADGRNPAILASFITPNDDEVKKLIARAAKILEEKTGIPSFLGYQSDDPNDVLKEMEALYLALQEEGIRYSNPPASFETTFQRVRLPYEVIREKTATCLDFALLYASLLEGVGLYPLVVLLKDHAMSGAYLKEHFYPEALIDNSTLLDNGVSQGIDSLALVNLADAASGLALSFEQAKNDGAEQIHLKEFAYALDIARSRKIGLLPIPTPHEVNGKSEIEYEIKPIKEDEIRTINPQEQGVIANKGKSKSKFDLWEEKLLDLNIRNNLINLHMGSTALASRCPDPLAFLSSALASGHFSLLPQTSPAKRSNEFIPFILSKSPTDFASKDLLSQHFLSVSSSGGEPEKSLVFLARKANTEIEESGCNPLYLTLGAIEWYDSEKSKRPYYAPILLIPASMPRRKNGQFYSLDIDRDGIQFNTTLFEYFKEFMDLDFSEFNALFSDKDEAIDLQSIYNTIRRKIEAKKGWKLFDNLISVSLFSFAHFVMWSDMKNYRDVFLHSPIVRSMVAGQKEWADVPEIPLASLDESVAPEEVFAPLSADSSQLEAILSAEKGESFVLDGPPGTGKSQTIANIIVNGIAQGKKILFVAEKEVALEVVKARLDQLGLGSFCLQIHSAKANKKDVLSQLSSALALGQTKAPEDFFKEANAIKAERASLNLELAKLHASRGFYVSIYDAILTYFAEEEEAKKITISEDYARKMNEEKEAAVKSNLSEIARYGKSLGGYHDNVFLPFASLTYSLESRDALFESLEGYCPLLDRLANSYAGFLAAHLPGLEASKANLYPLYGLLLALQKKGEIMKNVLANARFLASEKISEDYLNDVGVYLQHKTTLATLFNDSVFALDEKRLLERWKEKETLAFFPRLKTEITLLKTLRASAKNPKDISKKNYVDLLTKVKEANEEKAALARADGFLNDLFPRVETESLELYQKDVAAYHDTLAVAKILDRFVFTPTFSLAQLSTFAYAYKASPTDLFANDVTSFLKDVEDFASLNLSLRKKYGFDGFSLPDQPHYFSALSFSLLEAKSHALRLGEWVSFLTLLRQGEPLLPPELLSAYKEGALNEDELYPVFKGALAYRIVVAGLKEENLSSLNALSSEEKIAHYKETIARYRELQVQECAARVSAKYPSNAVKYARSALATSLKRYCASSGRGRSLRGIFDECGGLIKDLCPCFLMSPLSVAQYLAPDKEGFDIVIFDEASQIQTSEAIGSLARAHSAVIAGDQEQMPPSNYFESTFSFFDEEGDDASSEDLESFLDDMIALGLPSHRLNWHYRSHHESLIAFSNKSFYGNSLLSFPSPSAQESQVRFRQIGGHYEPGRGVNKDEANAIVKEILLRLKDPALAQKSIGVITFNEKQENLVEDLLQGAYDKDPTLSSTPGGESIFVKNLENVQGDERDVILFSICFAPDPQTRVMPLNFGPLSREKGERRLNVAISRARDEMIVFASCEPEDIRAERALNQGASYLRAFLSYAKFGAKVLSNNAAGSSYEEGASLAPYLAADLRKEGYEVDTDVGTSLFRIDIGIKDPSNPKEYALGIVMDNASYARSVTCVDRNVIQPMMLSRLHWSILRVWSVEYLDHGPEVVARIKEALAHPLPTKEEKVPEPHSPVILFPAELRNPYPHQIPYVEAMKTSLGSLLVYKAVEVIVNAEAPIAFSLLKKRVRDFLSLSRITPTVDKQIRSTLVAFSCHGEEIKGSNIYIWAPGQDKDSYPYFRIGGDRELNEVPYQEIANAMEDILTLQGPMSPEDLFRLVNEQFGSNVLGDKSRSYLSLCLRAGLKRNRNHLEMDESEVHIKA